MLKLSNLESIGKPVYKFQNEHSVEFDGVDDFIQLVEPISYTQHTISTWVKITNSGSSKTIFDSRDENDDGIRIFASSAEVVTYQLNTSDITSGSALSVDEWHHIVATYDGTTQKLYIDGLLVDSATTTQEVSVTTNAKIGARNFSDRAVEFLGKIDELAIFDRALEEEEVTKIFRIKYGANLVQNGNFDELGSELITNGDFATDSDWSLTNASISNGKVIVNSTSPVFITQSNVATVGKIYKAVITVSDYVEGALRLRHPFTVGESNFTGNGTYVFYGTATDSRFELQGRFSDQTYNYKIDNVLVKQVDPNDRWTLPTGGTFADSKVVFTSASGSFYQSLQVFSEGTKIRVHFTVTNYSSGSIKPLLFGGSSSTGDTVISENGTFTQILTAGAGVNANFGFFLTSNTSLELSNVMVEEQKYVATNLKLNSLPYSISNLRNYYRMGDGILDKFPFINDMIAPSLANISTTNLVTHSEDLSQWGQSNVTRTSGFTAPDGTNTAYKLTTTSDNENAGVHIDVTTVSGTTYVMSGFFKNQNVTGKTSFMARVSGGTLFRRSISFDGAIATTSTYASTGTVDGIQLFEKDNGWYRFSFYFVADGTTTQVEVDVDRENEAVGNAIYFWGAMLEEGFQASEYIKTEGSTVSRTSTVENVYGSMINMTEADITNDVPS